MKLCKDCKHFITLDDYCLCGRNEEYIIDPVLGRKFPSGRLHCHSERAESGENHCGPEGKFWEKA
jgi:hypothetical protein